MRKIINFFLTWRLLLFLPLVAGYYFLPYRVDFEYTNIWGWTKHYFPVNSLILYPWANFDGVRYLSIAGRGYISEAAFFPLYPVLIKFISTIFGTGATFGSIQYFSGILISNTLFFLSLIIFYKLVRLDFSEKVAINTILMLLVFPTSFFFVSIYSESLFLFLTLLCFYFARKGKWISASISAFFLSVTRLVGVLILPALIYEFIIQEKPFKDFKLSNLTRSIPFLCIPLGVITYSWFNLKKWGDSLYFIYAHGELANSRSVNNIVLFPQTIYRYLTILQSLPLRQYEWWIALLELSLFIFSMAFLYIAWKKKIRTSYLIFSVLAFLLPASSGTFTGLPRYSLVAFPIFITLSLIEDKTFKKVYIFTGSALLFILLMFFSKGYFVS